MNRKTLLTSTFAIVMAVMLSACGFQLRGSTGQDSLPFKSIYLNVSNKTHLGIELRRQLIASDIEIIDDAKKADVSFIKLKEKKSREIISLSSQGRAREYELTYTLGFQVKDLAGNTLLAPATISQQSTLNYSEAEVLAKEIEEANFYRDMQSDIVQQVMRRLATIKLKK